MPATAVPVYEGLLFSVFQQLRQTTPHGLALAFTSASPGEGVTHTVASLLQGLSREPSTRTLALDSRVLPRLDVPPSELLMGHVLNKRSYVVPDWIYRRL